MAAAILLAADGHRVTIFERFDAPRPIGSGLMLQPTGLAVLERMGLAHQARTLGARIDRLHGKANGRTVLDVSYAALPVAGQFAVGIHRSSLFDILYSELRSLPVNIVT